MRGLFLGFLVLVIAGASFLIWRSRGDLSRALNTQEAPAIAATPPPVSAKPNKAVKAHAASSTSTLASLSLDAAQAPIQGEGNEIASPPDAPRTPKPRLFPAPNQIAIGAHESALTQQYGDPALSTATLNNGHLVQTLIYAHDGDSLLTVIRVVDGTVSAAFAKTAPPSARGTLLLPQARND